MNNYVIAPKDELISIADSLRTIGVGNENMTWEDLITKANQAILNNTENLPSTEILPSIDIPDYVKKEAVRVANEVQKKIDEYGEGCIVFLGLSDTHILADTSKANYISAVHALMAAKILAYALKLDFVIHTGDVAAGASTHSPDDIKTQIALVTERMKEAFSGITTFCAIGNHDSGEYYDNAQYKIANPETTLSVGDGTYILEAEYLCNNLTKLCNPLEEAIDGEDVGGYCYKDIEDKHLRVFLLNSSESLITRPNREVGAWTPAVSDTQLQWLENNIATIPDDYKFIIICHYPADLGATMNLSNKIENLIGDSNIKTKFIAQFHGHTHNYLSSKLYNSNEIQYDAWRICIPCVEPTADRQNYYDTVSYPNISFTDPNGTYYKTAETAEDTAFVINIINPTRDTIDSIHYGAGYDRIIDLMGENIYYLVTSTLTNATLSNSTTNILAGEPYEATLAFDETKSKYKTVQVIHNNIDVTEQVYDSSTGNIVITSVEGNIEIVATGINYINQIPISVDANGDIYNGIGYANARLNSDGTVVESTETAKVYYCLTGFIPCTTNDTLYFSNVNNTNSDGYCRISLYNSNKEHITTISGTGNTTYYANKIYNDSGVLTSMVFSGNNTGVSFVRIVATGTNGINSSSIITVNDPIE